MNTVKVSFIVICKNAETYINRCIDSILNLKLKHFEIIVVDGNSSDQTLEKIANQPISLIIQQTGKGIGNARNEGLEAASGAIICFLDTDDYYIKDTFLEMLNCLYLNETLMALGAYLNKSNEQPLVGYEAYTPGGFIFRREIFEILGKFREDLEVASDHEWFIRLMRSGNLFQILPSILLIKEMHVESLSAIKKNVYRREMMQLLKTR